LPFTIKKHTRVLMSKLTELNVQAKVDLGLRMFYGWPSLTAAVIAELQKERLGRRKQKQSLRRARWCRLHRAAKRLAEQEALTE